MPELPKQHVQINALKPPETGQVDYYGANKDAGLVMRVSHTGRKTWFVRYYTFRKGKKIRAKFTIGRFPGIDLEEARRRKRKIEAKVDDGSDPVKDKKIEKRKEEILSVEALCNEFFTIREKEEYRGRVRRNVKDEQSMARCYIIPIIGSYAPHTVVTEDIEDLLVKVQEKCSPIRANRVLALMRVLFKYAHKTKKYIDNNPTEGIAPPAKEYPREIDPPKNREIKELWSLIKNGSVSDSGTPITISKQVTLALKLLLVTGQRSSEVSQAPIDEFDMDERVWIISGERTKNGKPHKIPLSNFAYGIVQEAIECGKEDAPETIYLFPGWPNGKFRGQMPIGKAATHHALKRVVAGTKLDRFTVHDFRKICATQMAELGVLMEIVSEILNHSVNSVTARHYAKPSYLPQMREALELWAEHLTKIVGKNYGEK